MVAIITPLLGGKVDFSSLEQLYRIHAEAGTAGVVVCGTTGESATLTHHEHQEVVSHAAAFFKKELKNKAPLLIAGTGSNSTHEANALTEHAVGCDVDAVLVITPYYNKPTPRGQIIHFREITRAAMGKPVILYNVPGRTGLKMNLETILTLAEDPNIVAIKEASGDLEMISEIVRRCPQHFAVISGEDNLTYPIMALGGIGVISVTANLIPVQFRDMIQACLAGDFKKALKIHQDQFTLTKALFAESSPIPVKTGMNLMAGKPAVGNLLWPSGGELRLPLCELLPATLDLLKTELKARNLI
jgi:4-hydroxy-tetrahydrodipicolinate synthase